MKQFAILVAIIPAVALGQGYSVNQAAPQRTPNYNPAAQQLMLRQNARQPAQAIQQTNQYLQQQRQYQQQNPVGGSAGNSGSSGAAR